MKVVYMLLPLMAIGVAGCHAGTESGINSSPPTTITSNSVMAEIPQSQLEDDLKQAIKVKTDTVMSSVKCKGSLQGKIGATQYCVATAEKDGSSAGVQVTATSVTNSGINYDREFVPVPLV